MSHNRAMRTRSRDGARRPAADSLVFSFLSAADAVEARLEAALSPTGLSLAKLAVLHFLADAKDGLVRRRADLDDRRSVLAELTPAGRQAHAKGVRALAGAQRAIVRPLEAGEATSLQNALGALSS